MNKKVDNVKKNDYTVTTMKIIFLDIDGCVSTPGQWKAKYQKKHIYPSSDPYIPPKYSYGMTQSCMDLLKEIIKKTQAQIVLSSTWRLLFTIEEIEWLFRQYNVDIKILDKTAGDNNGRGQQIKDWLDNHVNEVENYVVVDDNTWDIYGVINGDHVVKCDVRLGINRKKADQIIKILGAVNEGKNV